MLGTNYKEKKGKGGLFRDKIVKTSPFKKFMKGKRKKKVVSIEKNTINIYGDTMKINTKITILLLLLITIGAIYIFFFNTTEKQIYHNLDIDIPFSELKIIEKHNLYGDNFSHDGESLYLITSKKDLRSATKNWAKLPQKDILVYLFGEIGYSMKESLALPNIKNGRYKFINKSPNKKDYDFIICIYNEDNNEIYYVKFDT